VSERQRLPNRRAFTVIHANTEDNINGAPWPPDGADFWSIVDRTNGVTRWRRIALMEITRVALAASNARSSGGTTEGNKAMMQENEKSQSRTLTTHSTEIENIQTAAQEDAGFEKILKFKKGEYFIGEESVALGTEYIAHTKAWTKCWIKFLDGEVAERKTYRVALGERPLERDELDDNNEDDWPEGLDGRPADPWLFQYLLPFEVPSSGEVIIFATASFGGRRAVADLCSAYAKRTKKVENCGQPIIKLGVTDMPTKKFGKVPRPMFEVIGWDEAASGIVEVMPPGAVSKNEFGDEIPF
jgi:hypothetical protein